MPQIRSSDLQQLHSLMMQAHKQNKGYAVWADTLHLRVYRMKDDVTEYTTGDRTMRGKIIFKSMDSQDDL